MKYALAMLIILCLAVTAYSDDSSLSTFFNDTSNTVGNQTSNFVNALGAAGQAGPTAFGSVLDAFGPGNCGDDWSTNSTGLSMIVGTWLLPAAFIALIVLMGVSCVYMIGQLLNSPNLIALAKDELFQSFVTVYRVGFLIAILSAGTMWYSINSYSSADPIYGNPINKNMIDAAMSFSRLMVSDMITHYSMLILYNMVIHTLYSSTMWFGVTWRAMYSFNLGPVLKPLIDILGSSLQFLSLGISEWLLHIITLCLIKKWTWGLFIPLSMLLRAFPYTRNAGEALFALCFALATFYPLMFIFDYEVHKIMRNDIADPHALVSSFLNSSGILKVFGSALVAMLLMAGVFMPFFLGSALTIAFELIRGAVYYIVIMSIMIPFINIFVTLTAAREIAAFFKVDVNFMSFLKII